MQRKFKNFNSLKSFNIRFPNLKFGKIDAGRWWKPVWAGYPVRCSALFRATRIADPVLSSKNPDPTKTFGAGYPFGAPVYSGQLGLRIRFF